MVIFVCLITKVMFAIIVGGKNVPNTFSFFVLFFSRSHVCITCTAARTHARTDVAFDCAHISREYELHGKLVNTSALERYLCFDGATYWAHTFTFCRSNGFLIVSGPL